MPPDRRNPDHHLGHLRHLEGAWSPNCWGHLGTGQVKMARLKQTKDEAARDVASYRSQLEAEYQRKFLSRAGAQA
ncbi:hypothetical protein MLD38_024588 [Melastoma candidum]|uniref:Uncharacterized protein n=1 Tax=Melastoma candidum TaxID=119954 RepID=A0ACB9NSH0_9MYRT|nr:hypothetical protein MLD38_024588 [Melastoma candidum]